MGLSDLLSGLFGGKKGLSSHGLELNSEQQGRLHAYEELLSNLNSQGKLTEKDVTEYRKIIDDYRQNGFDVRIPISIAESYILQAKKLANKIRRI